MINLLKALTAIALLTITGCSLNPTYNSSRLCIDSEGVYKRCGTIEDKSPEGISRTTVSSKLSTQQQDVAMPQGNIETREPITTSRSQWNHKLLSDYVEQLAIKLVDNLDRKQLKGPIALTSFVHFDAQLTNTNALGNQLSEAFFHELQVFGLTVIDIKMQDFIKITNVGDFVLSRAAKNMASDDKFNAVLTGTMLKTRRGMVVNARIIDIDNKQVLSSAKGLIPNFILP